MTEENTRETVANAMADPETLRLVYDDLVHERDRLRDARRSVTSQLGPLPVASAVVVGLFGAPQRRYPRIDDGRVHRRAGCLLRHRDVSAIALGYQPYRNLRREAERASGWADDDARPADEWLSGMITVERLVKGSLGKAFDTERTFLLSVQWMLVAQVLLLGLIAVVAAWGR